MAKLKRGANPFYFLLVIVGVAFMLTASSYWMRAYRDVRPAREVSDAQMFESHPLFDLMDEHGTRMLVVELILLAILTVGAILTDEYWASRGRKANELAAFDKKPLDHSPEPEELLKEKAEL